MLSYTKRITGLVVIFSLAVFVSHSLASGPIIYPAKGQTAEQQNKDQMECKQWAINQTGVDPAVLASSPASVQSNQEGKVLRGAASGAALGAVGGAIGGSAGKGAKVGTAVGALGGGISKRRGHQETEAVNQQIDQQRQQAMSEYNRAYKTCLQGRDYTVN